MTVAASKCKSKFKCIRTITLTTAVTTVGKLSTSGTIVTTTDWIDTQETPTKAYAEPDEGGICPYVTTLLQSGLFVCTLRQTPKRGEELPVVLVLSLPFP